MGFPGPGRKATATLAAVILAVTGFAEAGQRRPQRGDAGRAGASEPIPARVNLMITVPGTDPPPGLRQPVSVDALGTLRTFLERVDVTETAAGIAPPGPGPRSVGATARTLAGWEDAHRFVRDAVRHVPYAGSVRGADGALETGAANSLDQALLLQALLRAQGIEARLMRGRLDWEAARRLVLGAAEPGKPGEADPWPRWLEIVADHWWLEADTGEGTVALDPSFSEADPGSTPGRGGRPVSELPDTVRGTLRVAVVRGDVTLAEAVLSTAEATGGLVELELVPDRVDRTVAGADDLAGPAGAVSTPGEPGTLQTASRSADPGPRSATPPVPLSGPADPGSTWREPLVVPGRPAPPRGPWMVRLQLPGRLVEAGPLEAGDLPNLELRLRVRVPHGPVQALAVPWGAGGSGRLTVVVAAGAVSAGRLAAAARPIYGALSELARAEVGARDALRPPRRDREGLEGLRRATEGAWEVFGRQGPAALGWALLRALDEVDAGSTAGRVLRPGLRLLAVRWRPPESGAAPSLAVSLDDPVVVGQLPPGLPADRVQSAHGLLQSAVLSQVLHDLVGEPPLTAFDVTLRAVGTGVGMGWFRSVEELPPGWPDTIRALAADDLTGAHLLIGPRQAPEDPALGAGIGWWQVSVADGRTGGKIVGPVGRRHGWVRMATRGWTDLDGLLGSLPPLHRSLRWLAGIGASDGSGLRDIAESACASAALVGSTLSREAPARWPAPAVDVYCGGRRRR